MTITDGTAVATAVELDEHRWKDRRLTSWSIRLLATALPLLAAASVTTLHVSVFDQPSGGLPRLVFWGGVLTGAVVTALFLTHWTRRLLPLAVMFRMTLAFPGEAPNRFVVALRETNAKQLENQLIEGSVDPHASAARNLISLVGLLRHHDRATRGHSERVATYAALIGAHLGLDDAEIDKLTWAALIHDIGKLSVPPRILNSSEAPDAEDRLLIRNHPVAATAYLGVASAWLGDWALAALEHHEHWNGSGYPSGFRGDEISLAGRIVAVADAYDVMTAPASYRTSLPVDQAREELARCAGSQFDPAVVHALLQIPNRRLRMLLGPAGWLHDIAWMPRPSEGAKVAVSTAVATLAVAAGTAFFMHPEPAERPTVAVAERVVAEDPTPTTAAPPVDVMSEAAIEPPTTTTATRAPALVLPQTTIPRFTTTTTTTTTAAPPLLGLAAVSGPTGSGFVLVDPDSLPRHLGDGELTSDEHAFVWFEPEAVIDAPLTVQTADGSGGFAGGSFASTVLDAGTAVCSAFIHTDPDGSTEPILIEIDFGVAPLGFALQGDALDASGSFGVEGLDHRSDGMSADDVGSIEGTTIRLTMTHSVSGRDQLRIFLPC